jgi:predicted metalloprotease
MGGGGLIGLIVIAAIFLLPRLLGGGDGTSLITPGEVQEQGVDEGDSCESEAEQIICGANEDVQNYWEDAYPESFGGQYDDTELVLFSGGTQTGCGAASSQTGPFYCPADGLVYIDIEFMDQLQSDFGAPGDLATAYIIAHEFGHHVQNLTGQNAEVQQASGDLQRRMGVALELQADCYAGTWVRDADERRNAAGEELIDEGELSEALDAAAAVGDDRIQMRTQGRVDSESFTHGSSEQRESWFRRGYETGDPRRCNTFDEVI